MTFSQLELIDFQYTIKDICKQRNDDWRNEVLCTMDLPAAPERLLNVIKCNCKMNCDTQRCSCWKHGLSCSAGCGGCRGSCCSNSMKVDTEDSELVVQEY